MDWNFELPALKVRHRGQSASEKALHVGSAAPIEASVALCEHEGIAGPVLPFNRDNVGVTRECDAWYVGRSNCRKQVGLAAL